MNANPLAHAPQQVSALANVEGQRAIQEVQAALVIAKRFPRDEKFALDRILNACSRVGLAEQSAYSFSRGGTEITGPSIRLAEAVAQYWGNIEFGFREIARSKDADGVGMSEVEAYAWDMESNTRRPARFTVRHWRDTKKGGYPIAEERDIYELVANMAQRRVRACLLAVIPGDIIEEAAKQCDATLSAKADTSPEAMAKLAEAFGKLGVTKEQIEKRIQRRLDSITAAQVVALRKIYASLRDGMSVATDWFEGATGTTGDNPLAKAKEEKPAETPPSEPTKPTAAQRKETALAAIDEALATSFGEPITRSQFENMLRAQSLLSTTGTLMGMKLESLENIAGSVATIVKAAAEGGTNE